MYVTLDKTNISQNSRKYLQDMWKDYVDGNKFVDCQYCVHKQPIAISIPVGGHVDVTCTFCGRTERLFSKWIGLKDLLEEDKYD